MPTHIASHTAPRRGAEHLGTEGFQEHARQALQDAPLQQALQLLVTNFVPRRVAAMAALGNAEELRTEARASKSAPWRAWMSTSNASPRRRSA